MSRYRQPNIPTATNSDVSHKKIEKHPYVAKQRIRADMTIPEKGGIERWNSMISKLQEAGLMEDRN